MNQFNTDKEFIKGRIRSLRISSHESRYKIPHEGLIIAMHEFKEPYPTVDDNDLIACAFMDLLIRYGFEQVEGRGIAKFTLQCQLLSQHVEGAKSTITLDTASRLTYTSEHSLIPKDRILQEIYTKVNKLQERYNNVGISAISVRIYCEGEVDKGSIKEVPIKESDSLLTDLYQKYKTFRDLSNVDSWDRRKYKKYVKNAYITKEGGKKKKTPSEFMVADMETIPQDFPEEEGLVHVPYAMGYMSIKLGKKVDKRDIRVFYADSLRVEGEDFPSLSNRMFSNMTDMMIEECRKKRKTIVIYFHNMARFDGLPVLRHMVKYHKDLFVYPLIREGRIYQINVYKPTSASSQTTLRLICRIQDSCLILPAKLDVLAHCLCPENEGKEELDHDSVTVDNLSEKKDEYISYLKQDIYLLGCIMQKAQQIYWDLYKIDVVDKLTIASMALSIFRKQFLNDEDPDKRIYIPQENVDFFIREGYYGGHADVYKPQGENLIMLDANSLYPSVMGCDMPGKLIGWFPNLMEGVSKMKLEDMFGFICALVKCPSDMHKPFLPHKTKDGTLLFPTGLFLGVYFSEELKYAKKLGYEIYPISGYLYERMESPFKGFVNELHNKRVEAKKLDNNALAYIHKTTMNSLYGRFAISSKSTVGVLKSKEEAKRMSLEMDGFIDSHRIDEDVYLVFYKSNTASDLIEDGGKPPANAAVQISAAITAYARIRMYPYISRDDCYYTDTDSIVVENMLPDEDISSTELGKFKIEHFIKRGVFLAPKSYMLETKDNDKTIFKHKGITKPFATKEWFINQLNDPELTQIVESKNRFHKKWDKLLITHKTTKVKMGGISKKREFVFNEDKEWVGTAPVHVGLEGVDTFNPTSHKALLNIIEQNESLKKELSRLLAKEEEKISFKDTVEEEKISLKDTVSDDEPSLKDQISEDSIEQKDQKEEVSDLIEDDSDQSDVDLWLRESLGIRRMRSENQMLRGENRNKKKG